MCVCGAAQATLEQAKMDEAEMTQAKVDEATGGVLRQGGGEAEGIDQAFCTAVPRLLWPPNIIVLLLCCGCCRC